MIATEQPPADADEQRRFASGDLVPDHLVTLAEGHAMQLSDLWRSQPLVLTFLRHLGCIFCREAVARLVAISPTLAESGARVGIVTLGTPAQAAAFCAQRAPGMLCLADPGGDLYRQFSIGRLSAGNVVAPGLWLAGMRATLAGHRQGRSVGDTRWVPGAFVIDTDGRIAYAHYATHAGDHAPDAEIVAAVRGLPGR